MKSDARVVSRHLPIEGNVRLKALRQSETTLGLDTEGGTAIYTIEYRAKVPLFFLGEFYKRREDVVFLFLKSDGKKQDTFLEQEDRGSAIWVYIVEHRRKEGGRYLSHEEVWSH